MQEALLDGDVPWRYARPEEVHPPPAPPPPPRGPVMGLPPLSSLEVGFDECEKALRYCLRLESWQHRSRLLLARLLWRHGGRAALAREQLSQLLPAEGRGKRQQVLPPPPHPSSLPLARPARPADRAQPLPRRPHPP